MEMDTERSTSNLNTNKTTENILKTSSPPHSSRSLSPEKKWHHRFRFSSVQFALLALLALQKFKPLTPNSGLYPPIWLFSSSQTYSSSSWPTIDLLLNKNVVQLIALCVFNTSMAIYGAQVLPNQIQKALHNPGGAVSWNGAREGTSCNMYLSCFGVQYLYGEIVGWIIAIPVIGGIVSILMAYLTWLIYKEFGKAQADLTKEIPIPHAAEIRPLLLHRPEFAIPDAGLKHDFRRTHSDHLRPTVQFGCRVSYRPLQLTPPILLHHRCSMLGGLAVSREIRWMMGIYYVCWTGATVYFIFKLIRLYSNDSISAAVRSLTIFSVLTIALLFATGIVSILCYQNFGKGLLETPAVFNESIWTRFWGAKNSKAETEDRNGTSRPGQPSRKTKGERQSRMTLMGRGNQEDLASDPEDICVMEDPYYRRPSNPTRPEMIQLRNQHYRMSLD
ncbi:hypothetical protein VP01_621g3 [Puccinia sorghi]|uniref:Uncharacterized protein n=1 Tax=Puccinia sorghi TaxID=27349 RepID=A0A0L6UGK9_9BASI|nr:hypothetical protein VP01_621g3 [Puccinia sorghi]